MPRDTDYRRGEVLRALWEISSDGSFTPIAEIVARTGLSPQATYASLRYLQLWGVVDSKDALVPPATWRVTGPVRMAFELLELVA